jgi:hypothetical protein
VIRAAELAIFLVPIAAFLVWRTAVSRGLDGPPPRQIAVLGVVVLVFAALLVWFARHERLPPGRYVPAVALPDGRIEPGHTQ